MQIDYEWEKLLRSRPVRTTRYGASKLERAAELTELLVRHGVVSKEGILVCGILLDEGFVCWLIEKAQVTDKSEKLRIGVLLEDLRVIGVVEFDRLLGPGALEARAVFVGGTESMCPAQKNNVLVVETHAVEDVPEVVHLLGCICAENIKSEKMPQNG